jgi:hypothetical protein
MSAPRRIRLLALLGLLAGALAAGCSATHDHIYMGTAIDEPARRGAIAAAPGFLGGRRLPPVAIEVVFPERAAPEAAPPAKPAAGAGAGADASAAAEPLAFDSSLLADELVEMLTATRVFESVIPLGEPAAPGRRGRRDHYAIEEEARARGASLLIEARIDKPVLTRTDDNFIPALLVWACSGAPSMWVHSQTFRLEFALGLRLHDLNTGEALPEKPLEPARDEEELNFHERTSSVWTYLLTNIFPSAFCPIDENKVARVLAPAALARPVGQFTESLGEAFKGEVYTFAVQPRTDGPSIRVRYPQPGKPFYLLQRTVRLSVAVDAREGDAIREVRLGGRVVFPARSELGTIARKRVRIEVAERVTEGEQLLLEAKDSKGRASACLIVASREAK